jgi:hypothetical protein
MGWTYLAMRWWHYEIGFGSISGFLIAYLSFRMNMMSLYRKYEKRTVARKNTTSEQSGGRGQEPVGKKHSIL